MTSKKPILRGYFHQEAFFTCLGACALLIARSGDNQKLISYVVYSFSLLFLFGVSAIYHRPHWEAKPRALLRRLDHAAIFILITGTATPICLLVLPNPIGEIVLTRFWIAAVIGVLQSIFWVKAPKWFAAILYVAMGWLIAPYLPELYQQLGMAKVLLILFGGVIYTIGAIFYALKRPKRNATHFGYHELFHICTIVAALLHFIVIYQLN
jgi:hemolysin III